VSCDVQTHINTRMIIINWPYAEKKYALQIVTIGSGVLLKTIYFNHTKSCDQRVRKYMDTLSKTTGYGYNIYINPTDLYDYTRLKTDIAESENSYLSYNGNKQLSVIRHYNLSTNPIYLKKLLKNIRDTCGLIIYKNICDTFKTIDSVLYRWPTRAVIEDTQPISGCDIGYGDNSVLSLYLKAFVSYRTVMSSNNEDLYLEMTNCRVDSCLLLGKIYREVYPIDNGTAPINVMINNRELSVVLKDCTIPNLFNIYYNDISLATFRKLYPLYAFKISLV